MQPIYREDRQAANVLNVHVYFLTTKLDDALDYFSKV